jgi:hypothetical protein
MYLVSAALPSGKKPQVSAYEGIRPTIHASSLKLVRVYGLDPERAFSADVGN